MNGKACRLLFRPCETAAIYRIWKRADCGKKRSPARLLGDTGKWEKFEGQLGAQTMLLYRNFSCLNLWGEHACTTCYSQCLQKRGYSFSSTCSTFSHTFLLVFIASCRKPIVKHIRWSLRLSPVKIILLIWSFLFINCIFSYTQRDITYFHNPTVFLTLTVYCTLRVSGEQFFFFFFSVLPQKKPQSNSDLSCSGNIGFSHSGCLHSEHTPVPWLFKRKVKRRFHSTRLSLHLGIRPKNPLRHSGCHGNSFREDRRGTVQKDFLPMFWTYGLIDFVSDTVWVSVKTQSVFISV